MRSEFFKNEALEYFSSLLVTGGNGFVGKALPAGALSKGCAVRVSSHQKLSAPKSRIEYCQVGDLGPATDWSAVLQGVDAVVHGAGEKRIQISLGSLSPIEYRASLGITA